MAGGTCPGDRTPRFIMADFLCNGFLSRDVSALIAVYRLLYSEAAFELFPIVPIPFREHLFNSKKAMRIAYWETDGVTESVPAMKRGMKIAKKILEEKGYELVPFNPQKFSRKAFILLCEALAVDGSVDVIKILNEDIRVCKGNKLSFTILQLPRLIQSLIAYAARPVLGEFPSEVAGTLRLGRHPHDMNLFRERVIQLRKDFHKEMKEGNFDAILCPAFACPALPFDVLPDALGAATYTCIFNILNLPAGVVPVTKVSLQDEKEMQNYPGNVNSYQKAIKNGLLQDSVGLPIAVQIASRQYHEEVVLKLMKEIEENVNYHA